MKGNGCFFQYEYYNKKTNSMYIMRGLYDGTPKSRMDIVLDGKILCTKKYNLRLSDIFTERVEKLGYTMKRIASEDYSLNDYVISDVIKMEGLE